MNKLAVLEGLLFVVGDEGLKIDRIAEILEVSEEEARKLLKSLQEEYEKDTHGIRISFLADTFKLTTKKEHIDYYKKLITTNENTTLSDAALETLAIIAYNQPITRVKIDELRGITSSYLVKKLIALDLVKTCGKSDLPGKPNLYKTTPSFLDYFGLATLNDLPDIGINEKDSDDIELYTSNYKDV